MAALIEEGSREYGVKTFLDEKDIEGGESIPESIRENIEGCDEFLVFLSRYSIDREWVLIEIGAAWGLNKPVIPIVTHRDVFSRIPLTLREVMFVELEKLEDPEIMDRILEHYEKMPTNGKMPPMRDWTSS